MDQNSLKIFKISSIAFIATFVVAIILFMLPKAGNLSSITYQEAIAKAKEKNLPIMITTYSKWDKNQKISNQILFTDKKLLDFINKNLITVILDYDNNGDLSIINQLGLSSGFGLILDKTGKPITYIPNSSSSMEFTIFLNEVLQLPFFKWDNINDAIQNGYNNKKNIIVFYTNSINDNLKIAEILKNPINEQYLEMNYNPVLLYLQYKPDFEEARQILGFDDKLIKDIESNKNKEKNRSSGNNPFANISQFGTIKVTILSPNRYVMAQGEFDDKLFQTNNLQGFIEDLFIKEEKRAK